MNKHKKKTTFIFMLFWFTMAALSQNLVPNPSFEIYDDCPNTYTMKPAKTLIPNWNMPTKGTSDYFNGCTKIQVSVPSNFMGYLFAKNGQAYVGLVLLEKPLLNIDSKIKRNNYREYIQAELMEPLVSGEKYVVKFNYAIANYSTYAINNIGIYFSQKQIKNNRNSKVLNYPPQIKADTSCIYQKKSTWIEVVDTLTANGGERFITIGNFYSTQETRFETLNISDLRNSLKERIRENKIAYYYIDDISVRLLSKNFINEN